MPEVHFSSIRPSNLFINPQCPSSEIRLRRASIIYWTLLGCSLYQFINSLVLNKTINHLIVIVRYIVQLFNKFYGVRWFFSVLQVPLLQPSLSYGASPSLRNISNISKTPTGDWDSVQNYAKLLASLCARAIASRQNDSKIHSWRVSKISRLWNFRKRICQNVLLQLSTFRRGCFFMQKKRILSKLLRPQDEWWGSTYCW